MLRNRQGRVVEQRNDIKLKKAKAKIQISQNKLETPHPHHPPPYSPHCATLLVVRRVVVVAKWRGIVVIVVHVPLSGSISRGDENTAGGRHINLIYSFTKKISQGLSTLV